VMEGGVVARSCSYSWVVISGNGRVWTQKRRRGVRYTAGIRSQPVQPVQPVQHGLFLLFCYVMSLTGTRTTTRKSSHPGRFCDKLY
jgi:hypothetical protein